MHIHPETAWPKVLYGLVNLFALGFGVTGSTAHRLMVLLCEFFGLEVETS